MCQHYPTFRDQGLNVFAIVNEDASRCANLKTEYRALFPFLADEDRQLVRTYGVFHMTDPDGRPIPVPGAFLIDAEGVVRYSFVGATPSDRPDLDEIMDAILALR